LDAFKKYPFTVQAHFRLFLMLLAVMLHSSCASRSPEEKEIGKINTRSIVFTCEPHINQGLLLPVDVIYITKYRSLREVTSIGPDDWFNTSKREAWETKQTLSLSGGDTRSLKLDKQWLKNTKVIVIFADFKDVKEPNPQQMIIDRSEKRKEKILVMPQQLAVDRKRWPCLFF